MGTPGEIETETGWTQAVRSILSGGGMGENFGLS